jgi:Membrane transporters of cations and cationic drugs
MPVPASTYLLLAAAIVAEVIATTALSRTAGFTRLFPSLLTILFYAIAFWLLSITLKTMNTGVVYAIWSGAGVVLIALVAWLVYGQKLDLPAVIGLSLIVAGVVIVNFFSKSVGH